ncbi:unnamed protein product [Sphagnum compactum]
MPEYPKALSQEICENISDLFPQCLDTGSLLFCNNSHGGAGAASVESGGISVLGKKRHSQLEFVDGKRCRNMGLGHAKADRKMTTPQPSLEVLGASTGLKASPAASTLKPLIDTPSNHSELQNSEEVTGLVGGVRFREKLKKFVVEHRPSKFKWKLWVGTYPDLEQGKRAIDAARFYTGQENGQFYFPDSPAIFRAQGPLPRPFSTISKEIRDKQFNLDVKRRAKAAVKKDVEARKAKERQQQPVTSVEDVDRGLRNSVTPSIGFDSIPAIMTSISSNNTGLGDFSNLDECDDLEYQEFLDFLLEENQEGEVEEVTSKVVGNSSSMNLGTTSNDPSHVVDQWLFPDCVAFPSEAQGLLYCPSFDMGFDDIEFCEPGAYRNIRSSLTYMSSGEDLLDYDVQLWEHN